MGIEDGLNVELVWFLDLPEIEHLLSELDNNTLLSAGHDVVRSFKPLTMGVPRTECRERALFSVEYSYSLTGLIAMHNIKVCVVLSHCTERGR